MLASQVWKKVFQGLKPGPKINTRQAPNESKNRRWRVNVTMSVARWRVTLFLNITMQFSENNRQL